jgi:hypothetical protein
MGSKKGEGPDRSRSKRWRKVILWDENGSGSSEPTPDDAKPRRATHPGGGRRATKKSRPKKPPSPRS